MSEQLLRSFRDDAVHRTRVPAFEQIEAAGRSRRRRRRAFVGAAATALVVGGFAATWSNGPDTVQPAQDRALPSGVMPYPGPVMTTLDEGTYELEPSSDPEGPVVRFTVPGGWNAWEGPNRFEGLAPGVTDNEQLLERTPWIAGLVVMDVSRVVRRSDCQVVDLTGRGPAALVRSLGRLPHVDVLSGPVSTVRFGVPATYFELRERPATRCLADHLFTSSTWVSVGMLLPGATYDAWVLDAGDRPLLVWAYRSRGTPPAEVDALAAVVDSLEVRASE
jgi:hypothetical protein